MKFRDLPLKSRFRFAKRTEIGAGMFNEIGVKKAEFIYRMSGANHTVGNSKIEVELVNKNNLK